MVRLPTDTRAAIAAARAAQLAASAKEAVATRAEEAAAAAAVAPGEQPQPSQQHQQPPKQHGYERYKEVLAAVGGFATAARLVMQTDRVAFLLLERAALKLQNRYRSKRARRRWRKTIASVKVIQTVLRRRQKRKKHRLDACELEAALSIQARYRRIKARECMREAMQHIHGGNHEAAVTTIELLRSVFDHKGGRTAHRNVTRSLDEAPPDPPAAVELVLVGGDTLRAELSSTAAKDALARAMTDLLGVAASRVRLELTAGSVVLRAAVAGADSPSARSTKEAVAALLGTNSKGIVGKLRAALGGLISCELELKGPPSEIAPMVTEDSDRDVAMLPLEAASLCSRGCNLRVCVRLPPCVLGRRTWR